MGAHSVIERTEQHAGQALDAPTNVLRRPVAPMAPVQPAMPPRTPVPARLWGPDAPPAGLDAPLPDAPMPWGAAAPAFARSPQAATRTDARPAWQRRTPVIVAGVGAAVVLVGGLATVAQATVDAASSSSPSTSSSSGSSGGSSTGSSGYSSAARQCADVVSTELDQTASAIRATSPSTWSSLVAGHQSRLASTYGTGSPEYSAYTSGASEILSWLADSSDHRTYGAVVQQVVPQVVSTCAARS